MAAFFHRIIFWTLTACAAATQSSAASRAEESQVLKTIEKAEELLSDNPYDAIAIIQSALKRINKKNDPADWFALKVQEMSHRLLIEDMTGIEEEIKHMVDLAELSRPADIIILKRMKGNVLDAKGRKVEALGYFNDALTMAEELQNQQQILNTVSTLGWFYLHNYDVKKSLEFFIRGRELARKLNLQSKYHIQMGGIAAVYTFGGEEQQNEAMNIYDELIQFARTNKLRYDLAIGIINKAQLYHQRKEYARSIATLLEARIPLESLQDNRLLGHLELKLAANYAFQQNPNQSLDAFKKAEYYFEKLGNKMLLADTHLVRALSFLQLGRSSEALEAIRKYESFVLVQNLDPNRLTILELKARIYEALSREKEELASYREAYPMLIEENKVQTQNMMARFTAELELERKATENKHLAELNRMQKETHALETRLQTEQLTYEREKSLLALVTALALLFLAAVLVIMFVRVRSRNKKIESMQNYIHKRVLGRFLPPLLVEEIIQGRSTIESKPHEQLITIVFADLVAFTSLSGRLGAAVTADVLNSFMHKMAECIYRHGGTIDKFIGDSVMILFGAPVPMPAAEQVQRACACARDMQSELDELNKSLLRFHQLKLDMRIGINQGEAIVGTFGNEQRSDYTAIGPSVNLASRIEGKAGSREVLLSQNVIRHIPSEQYEFRGNFELKGIEGVVPLFALRLDYDDKASVAPLENATAS